MQALFVSTLLLIIRGNSVYKKVYLSMSAELSDWVYNKMYVDMSLQKICDSGRPEIPSPYFLWILITFLERVSRCLCIVWIQTTPPFNCFQPNPAKLSVHSYSSHTEKKKNGVYVFRSLLGESECSKLDRNIYTVRGFPYLCWKLRYLHIQRIFSFH